MTSILARRAVSALSLVTVGIALSACNDSSSTGATAPPVAANLIATNGVGQTARVGAVLPDSFAVVVTASDGSPVAGVSIAWSVARGGGAVSAATTTTDASGHSAIAYTAGGAVGAAAVTASVPSLPALQFDATLVPSAPASMVADSAYPQTLIANSSVPLQVRLTDAFGNAIPNYPILWTIATGDAGDALDATASITDLNGIARVTFAADSVTGPRAINATTPEGVSFMLSFMVDSAPAVPAPLHASVKR